MNPAFDIMKMFLSCLADCIVNMTAVTLFNILLLIKYNVT